MKEIHYTRGDATEPIASKNKIVCHICNDAGFWGRGFVLAISSRWPEPEKAFRSWYQDRNMNDYGLGNTQFVQVSDDIWIANMIGQSGIQKKGNLPPIRYEAVRSALSMVQEKATELKASIHMPRIGCGLAGGNWGRIEPIIKEQLSNHDIRVTVYDF